MQLNKFLLFVVIACGQALSIHAAATSSTASTSSTSSAAAIAQSGCEVWIKDKNGKSMGFECTATKTMGDVKKKVVEFIDEQTGEIKILTSGKKVSDDQLACEFVRGLGNLHLVGAVFKQIRPTQVTV